MKNQRRVGMVRLPGRREFYPAVQLMLYSWKYLIRMPQNRVFVPSEETKQAVSRYQEFLYFHYSFELFFLFLTKNGYILVTRRFSRDLSNLDLMVLHYIGGG